MKQLILITLFIFSVTLYSQDSKIDWNSDLGFLKIELPKNHFDFDKLSNHDNFIDEINQVSTQLDNLTDFEIVIKLGQIIAGLGDSHTNVNWGKHINREKILPLNLFCPTYFEDIQIL